jgi:hypothetical protein
VDVSVFLALVAVPLVVARKKFFLAECLDTRLKRDGTLGPLSSLSFFNRVQGEPLVIAL